MNKKESVDKIIEIVITLEYIDKVFNNLRKSMCESNPNGIKLKY